MNARRRMVGAGVVAGTVAAVLLAASGAGAARSAGPREVDCSVAKCVALTFDDGPGSQIPQLLRMLKAAGAHATFFVVGEMAAERPEALRQIVAAGDEIGDHSWSHPKLTKLTDDAVRSQITRTADVVEQATGMRPELMRPPYGDLNSHVRHILGDRDWPIILWTVDPEDWKDRNSDTVYRRVVSQTSPGAIVLMHDIHPTTVAAVPRILATLKHEGYTFVTVSHLYGNNLIPGKTYRGRVRPDSDRRRTNSDSDGGEAQPGSGTDSDSGSGKPDISGDSDSGSGTDRSSPRPPAGGAANSTDASAVGGPENDR